MSECNIINIPYGGSFIPHGFLQDLSNAFADAITLTLDALLTIELYVTVVYPVIVYKYNLSAISMLNNGFKFQRSKQILIKINYIRGYILTGAL